MGHMIAAAFSDESRIELKYLMKKAAAENAIKLPFRHGLDREQANSVIGYHITLFNWSSEKDAEMFSRLEGFSFTGEFKVTAEKLYLTHGHDDSLLLCLKIKTDSRFSELTEKLGERLKHKVGEHPHITLAVSKDHDEIHKFYKRIKAQGVFPIELTADHREVYKIGAVTEKVSEIRN